MHHHVATDPATASRDRRLWIVETIRREREGFSRGATIRKLSDELWRLRREAARRGWPDDVTFNDAVADHAA